MSGINEIEQRMNRLISRVQAKIEGDGSNRIIHLYVQEGGKYMDVNDPRLWTPAPTPEAPGTYVPGKGLLVVHWPVWDEVAQQFLSRSRGVPKTSGNGEAASD